MKDNTRCDNHISREVFCSSPMTMSPEVVESVSVSCAKYPIKNYRGLSPDYRGKRWAYVLFIRGAANPPIIYLCAHLRFTPRSLQVCLFAHFNK